MTKPSTQTEQERKRQQNRMEADRFAMESVGIRLVNFGVGHARAELTVQGRHLNGVAIVQGGVLFTLADFAFAAACNYSEEAVIGIETSISFLKASGEGVIQAEAREVSRTGRLAYGEIRVTNDQGELLAMARGRGYVLKRS